MLSSIGMISDYIQCIPYNDIVRYVMVLQKLLQSGLVQYNMVVGG